VAIWNAILGCDPGRTGGFAEIRIRTQLVRVWPMPEADDRGLNVEGVLGILDQLTPTSTLAYLEWPSGRPGESAEFAFRFGLQCGALDAALKARGFSVRHLSPNAWTGALRMVGKHHPDAIKIRQKLWAELYPAFSHLTQGKRGGTLDGILDAALIAHYGLLANSGMGLKTGRKQSPLTLETFGAI
jgi:hypothetical protein